MRRLGMALVLTVFGTSACDSDGPLRPPGLTAADVQGAYRVCEITFRPEGTIPDVDVIAAAFETENAEVQRPQLNIDSDGSLELEYTPKGESRDREIAGAIAGIDGTEVTIRFQAGEIAPSSLLMPTDPVLTYTPASRTLHQSQTPPFFVPRAVYAEMAGISETNLSETIEGTGSLRFSVGGCD